MLHNVTLHIDRLSAWAKKFFACSILFFGIAITVYSQDSDSIVVDTNNINEYKRNGNYYHRKGDIYSAIENYAIYLDFEPGDTKIGYRLGSLYFATRNYALAKKWYDKVLTFDEAKFPEAMYYAGLVSQNLESYEEAMVYFKGFRKAYRGKKDPQNLRKRALSHLKSCEWVLENQHEQASIFIAPLNQSINQEHIEFAPHAISEDEFIFGAIRVPDASSSIEVRQLYAAKKKHNSWEFDSELSPTINTPTIHTGNAALSPDGLRMYFTRCEENWQDKMICSIWLSNKEDGEWQKAEKLPYPINSDSYTTTQPAVGINQRTGKDVLYFVSDRPGTKGGMDIWYSEMGRSDNKFKTPSSLGRNVNSAANDITPYFDFRSSTLYFSSNGRNGFGGYDVYKTLGSRKSWDDAEHLPRPINTSFDDYYFNTLPNGNEGFFSSNRSGTNKMTNGNCCDDIFKFKYNNCVKVIAKGKVINQTNYDIFDDLNERYNLQLEYPEDKLPMKDIPIEVHLNNNGEQVLYYQSTTDINGEYTLNLDIDKDYTIIVKNYGFFDKKKRIHSNTANCSDTINIGITQINYLPEITVRVNVYYEHNKARLSSQATNTIDSLLSLFDLFPNAIIEAGSHTDNTGSDNYNLRLSQKRSESVVNYLTEKGISPNRLVAKGYGESQPIAPNTNPDGSDNPENRQLNRRTEMKIVGVIDEFGDDGW